MPKRFCQSQCGEYTLCSPLQCPSVRVWNVFESHYHCTTCLLLLCSTRGDREGVTYRNNTRPPIRFHCEWNGASNEGFLNVSYTRVLIRSHVVCIKDDDIFWKRQIRNEWNGMMMCRSGFYRGEGVARRETRLSFVSVVGPCQCSIGGKTLSFLIINPKICRQRNITHMWRHQENKPLRSRHRKQY